MKLSGLIFIFNFPLSFATFVAEFQMDGKFTTETYMNYTRLGPEIVNDFTICWWQYVNYLRDSFSHSISYTSNLTDNALVAYLKRYDLKSVHFKICKHLELHEECLEINADDSLFQQWHHICFVITYQKLSVRKSNSLFKHC